MMEQQPTETYTAGSEGVEITAVLQPVPCAQQQHSQVPPDYPPASTYQEQPPQPEHVNTTHCSHPQYQPNEHPAPPVRYAPPQPPVTSQPLKATQQQHQRPVSIVNRENNTRDECDCEHWGACICCSVECVEECCNILLAVGECVGECDED